MAELITYADLTDYHRYAPKFLRVKRREGGAVVPFHLKPIQRRIDAAVMAAEAAGTPALIIINKSRRLGSSTYVASRFMHRIATRPYQRGIVMAHRGPDAKIIFSIYELMHEHLPAPIRPERAGGKGQKIDLQGLHSSIDVGSAESTTFGRGGDAQLVHLSEAAYYPDPEELLAAILPGVSARGDQIIVLESTANGPKTWWHDQWTRAKDRVAPLKELYTPSFTPLFFSWPEDPEHRLERAVPAEDYTEEEKVWSAELGIDGHQIAWLRWRQEVDCQGRDDRRRREYPTTEHDAFTAVGQVAWDNELIIGSSTKPGILQEREPLFRGTLTVKGLARDPEGRLEVWEEPRERADYVIGADPAGGIRDRDLAAAEVYRVAKGEWPVQVAQYAAHDDPINFAQTLTMLGTYYRKALIACETTGVGRGCQAALQKTYYYPRLHRWVKWDAYKQRGDTWGWETTPQSLDVMVGLADWLIRTGRVRIHSGKLAHELLNYQEIAPGKYEVVSTEEGHGDRLMASFIAWASWFQHVFAGVPLKDLRETLAKLYGGTGRETGKERPLDLIEPLTGPYGITRTPDMPRGDLMRAFNRGRRGIDVVEGHW